MQTRSMERQRTTRVRKVSKRKVERVFILKLHFYADVGIVHYDRRLEADGEVLESWPPSGGEDDGGSEVENGSGGEKCADTANGWMGGEEGVVFDVMVGIPRDGPSLGVVCGIDGEER